MHIGESRENRGKGGSRDVGMVGQLYYAVDAADEQHNCWEDRLLLLLRELVTCVRCRVLIALAKPMSHDCQAHGQISTITKLDIEALELL